MLHLHLLFLKPLVRKINESNSREWANCKKLAEICNTFCEDFKFDTREGFIKYIETGLKRMTDYRNVMQRLISMQDNITNQIDAEIELNQRMEPGITRSDSITPPTTVWSQRNTRLHIVPYENIPCEYSL